VSRGELYLDMDGGVECIVCGEPRSIDLNRRLGGFSGVLYLRAVNIEPGICFVFILLEYDNILGNLCSNCI